MRTDVLGLGPFGSHQAQGFPSVFRSFLEGLIQMQLTYLLGIFHIWGISLAAKLSRTDFLENHYMKPPPNGGLEGKITSARMILS